MKINWTVNFFHVLNMFFDHGVNVELGHHTETASYLLYFGLWAFKLCFKLTLFHFSEYLFEE